MPICHKCGRMAATAEMRRSTKPGLWLCKESEPCAARRKSAAATLDAALKGSHPKDLND